MNSQGVYWVCDTCLHAHANGIDLRYESLAGMDYDPEDNPSPEPEPWSLLKPGQRPAMGMDWEEHSCELGELESDAARELWAGGYECDCGRIENSASSCEGCGNRIHGTRHAVSVFSE